LWFDPVEEVRRLDNKRQERKEKREKQKRINLPATAVEVTKAGTVVLHDPELAEALRTKQRQRDEEGIEIIISMFPDAPCGDNMPCLT
jgi:hypothetical protein